MYRGVIVEGIDVLEEFAFRDAFRVVLDSANDVGLFTLASMTTEDLNKGYFFAGF